MRFMTAFVLWVLAVGAAHAQGVEAACNTYTDFTVVECTCLQEQAGLHMTEDDYFYLELVLSGPDAARAALEDLAGDSDGFMLRYALFSAGVDQVCFPIVTEEVVAEGDATTNDGATTTEGGIEFIQVE